MTDILAAELFIDDSKAITAIKRYRAELQNTDKVISSLNSGASFGKEIEASLARQEVQLKRGLALQRQYIAAIEGEDEALAARNRFARQQVGGSRAGQLDPRTIERRAGRAATANRFNKAGEAINIADRLGVPLANEAGEVVGLAATLSQAGLLAPKLLAVAGSAAAVGAAGFAVVKVTEKLREQAEKRLETEEKIQAVYNKQAASIAGQAVTAETLGNLRKNLGISLNPFSMSPAEFAATRIQQERIKQGFGFGEGGLQTLNQSLAPERAMRDFKREIANASNSATELESILKRLNRGDGELNGEDRMGLIRTVALQIDETKRSATGFSEREIEANKRRYEQDRQNRIREVTEGFKESIEVAKRNVPQLRKILSDIDRSGLPEEARKALAIGLSQQINQLIEQGIGKAEEYRRTVTEFANGLAQQAGANNPFVRVYSDAENAIQRAIQATRGLSKETQELFLNQTKALNARALFDARLDSGLNALSLRDDAAGFRRVGAQQRLAAFDIRRQAEEAGGLFRNPQYTAAIRSALERDTQGGSVSERLQRQLDFVQRQARTPEERASADRRIIQLTSGIDPKEITDRQREEAAAAREREAGRLENAEKEAIKDAEAKKVQDAQVAKDIGELLKIVKEGGVEALIRIIDDTGGRVESRLQKRATGKNTDAYYQ